MDNILELHQVCKTFPKTNFTLDHVSFSIPYGSIMGFVGENGAGKTTTIGCVLNTVSKDSGTIKIFGKELADTDSELKEKIGVVYDGDNFPAYWTAEQLSDVMQGLYANWDNDLFKKYLNDFRLLPNQKIKSYSRGMTMKLAVAAALSHHQQLLILDEATSGLDPIMRDDMLDVFLEFNEEEVLKDKGRVSAEIAKSFAESEFEKYRIIQDGLFMSDFDKYMLELEGNAKK